MLAVERRAPLAFSEEVEEHLASLLAARLSREFLTGG
jgi:hypothetical protein